MATRVDINLALANQLAMDAAERGVRAVVIDAEGITKTLLSQPGSGRLYSRGKTVEHRASAPGEPPAPDTGRLRASVTTEVVRGANEVIGYVAVNTEYAAALELGTEKVKPRPYLSRVPREFGARLRAVFNQFART
jgi:hypothetical protein